MHFSIWVRQIWFRSGQIQVNSQAWQVQHGLLTRACALHVSSPWVATLPQEAQCSRCQGHAKPTVPCWPGFGFAGGTGATCRVRVCHGEQVLWKKSSKKGPCTVCQSLLMESCSKTRRFLHRERPRKGSLVVEVSSELVGSELTWLIPIVASFPHPMMNLVPTHQLGIDSLSHLPAKGEVDVMEYLVFVFLMFLFMQVREACLRMEGKFGEDLRSLKRFNPQAEGSG